MTENKYRFDVINNMGYQEQYTGLFDNRSQAEAWFNQHGKWLMDQGRKLIMVKCQAKSDNSLQSQEDR